MDFPTETANIAHRSRYITLWFDKNFILFGIVLYFAFWIWLAWEMYKYLLVCWCVCACISFIIIRVRLPHSLSKMVEMPWAIYLIHLVKRVYISMFDIVACVCICVCCSSLSLSLFSIFLLFYHNRCDSVLDNAWTRQPAYTTFIHEHWGHTHNTYKCNYDTKKKCSIPWNNIYIYVVVHCLKCFCPLFKTLLNHP